MKSLVYFPSLFLFFSSVLAIGQNATIGFTPSAGGLKLGDRGSYVQVMVDAADWPGVLRVADDLAIDFGRVTGLNGSVDVVKSPYPVTANASMIYNVTGRKSFNLQAHGAKGGVIIAGTIGNSSLIDNLVKNKKIDVAAIKGKRESFTSAVVKNPIVGISSALVIAGSDKRGSIYGLYDISEQIGVSPWYFWADVPPKTHGVIYALDARKVQGPPSVKYRGFFLNDEAPGLTGYINAKFPQGKYGPGYNADFYKTVFELLLRLRANYLWPTMWNSMFNIDDPRNQPLADGYGIVMGTSHTEPFMRATKEWSVFGKGSWQWNTNNASIKPFMYEGAVRAKPYEGVLTMGMRGSGDTALAPGIETAMLENIVDTQRQMLAEIYGENGVSSVPQMWCLYKEVQGYYEAGMRVPDDITLLWTDDNWGNIRRLPMGNETDRSGGAGVYYHFDYVGDPRDYKWINTIQLQRTWQQMYLAYQRQARDIWVVNVGDLKPLEIPISYFMDLAYDVALWGPDSVPKWLELWATREFGPDVAKATAKVMDTYGKLANRRKYELVDMTTYSIINYEEGDRVLAEWSTLAAEAQKIYDSLPPNTQPAFFEMVLHPVLGGSTVYDIHLSSSRNNLYAWQGRNSANALAQHVLEKFNYDHKLTVQYNTLLGGKWAHMMDQTHLGYRYWQQPMRQATPPLQYVQTLERALTGDMGVAIEGSNATVPGDDQYHSLSSNSLTLPPVDPYSNSKRWMDIFNVGTNAFTFKISAAPYIKFSQSSGTISPTSKDIRVYISVDWVSAPAGSSSATINITSSTDYGAQFGMPSIILPISKTSVASSFTSGFVESDGHISIEAEHYTRKTSGSGAASYMTIPSYGRTLSSVDLGPYTTPPLTTSSAPGLEYDIYTFTSISNVSKPLNLTLYLGTGLNSNPSRPLRYAIAIDDQTPKEVKYIIDQTQGSLPVGWTTAVADAVWKSTTNWTLPDAGKHTVKYWALEPGVVLQKFVLDFGGVRNSYLGPPESWRVDVNGTSS